MAVSSVTEERPQRLRRMRILPRPFVLTTLAVLIVAALAILAALAFDASYTSRVLPGVSVAGVDASGLTAEELTARLKAVAVAPEAIEIVTEGRSMMVASADLGRRVDVDGAVAAALAAGRVSGPLADLPERLGMLRDGRPIDLATSVDKSVLVAWAAERAKAVRVTPEDARISATVDGWVATRARDGKVLDEGALVAALEAVLVNRSAATARIEVPITIVAPATDNLDADLAIAAAGRMIQPLKVYFRDDASWTIPTPTLRAAIRFEDGDERPVPVFDTEALTETLSGFAKDIARPANETLILKSKSGKAFGFVPGKNGRNVDIAATAGQIGDILAGRADGTLTAAAAAPIVLSVLPPELSAAEASASTHQVSLVGAWTTRFVTSEKNGFGNNIRIPARLINGTVVGPGQVFDFWGAVGPRDVRPRVPDGWNHRERPYEPERRHRWRDLLGLDDDVQRSHPGRLPGPGTRPAQLLHQSLPARPRRDRLEVPGQDRPEHAVPERYGEFPVHPRPIRSRLGALRDLLGAERPNGHVQPAIGEQRPEGDRHDGAHVEPQTRPDQAHRVPHERDGRRGDPNRSEFERRRHPQRSLGEPLHQGQRGPSRRYRLGRPASGSRLDVDTRHHCLRRRVEVDDRPVEGPDCTAYVGVVHRRALAHVGNRLDVCL